MAALQLDFLKQIINVHWGGLENFAAVWSDSAASHLLTSKDGTSWQEVAGPGEAMTALGYGGGYWYVGTASGGEEGEPACSIMQSDTKMETWSDSYSDTGLVVSIAGGRGPNGTVIVAAIRARDEPGDTEVEASVRPSKLVTYAKPDPDPESIPEWSVTKIFGNEGQVYSVSFCKNAFFACIGCGDPRGGSHSANPETPVMGGAAIYRSEDGISWTKIYSDNTTITRTVISDPVFSFWQSCGSTALGVGHYREEDIDHYCAYVATPTVLMNTAYPAPQFMTSSDGESFTGGSGDSAHWAILGYAPCIAGGAGAFSVAATQHKPLGEGEIGFPRAVPTVPVDILGPGAGGKLDFEPPPLVGGTEPGSSITGAPVAYSKTEKKFAIMGMGNVLAFEVPLQVPVRIYSSSKGKSWTRVYSEIATFGDATIASVGMMGMAVGNISKYIPEP